MAFDNPPWLIDGTTVDGEVIRRALGTLVGASGIVTAGDLACTAQGSPNMSVNMAVGQAWVEGTVSTTQGPYYGRNGAPVTIDIDAASSSEPRIDMIGVEILDEEYAGSSKVMQPFYVVGTPTAGALYPSSIVGLGSLPASCLVTAYVNVPQSATSITTGDIFNVAPVMALKQAGIDGGVASLDSTGNVPATQLENILTGALNAIGSYTSGTIRQPSTTRPTLITATSNSVNTSLTADIGATSTPVTFAAEGYVPNNAGASQAITFLVPPGWYYKVLGTSLSVNEWTL